MAAIAEIAQNKQQQTNNLSLRTEYSYDCWNKTPPKTSLSAEQLSIVAARGEGVKHWLRDE